MREEEEECAVLQTCDRLHIFVSLLLQGEGLPYELFFLHAFTFIPILIVYPPTPRPRGEAHGKGHDKI